MSDQEKTGGEVAKATEFPGTVMDWRRDPSFVTLEALLGISLGESPASMSEAMTQHAALACVDVISRDVSNVEVALYRRLPGGGKEKVMPGEHWLADMLALDPNEEHDWTTFWQMCTIHLVLASNTFIAKRMNFRSGRPTELIPLRPGQVTINHNPSTFEKSFHFMPSTLFEQSMVKGMDTIFTPEEIIHVRRRVMDGLSGLSTLSAGGPTLRLSKAISEYQTRLYKNDGQGRVSIESDKEMKPLGDDAFRRLKAEVRAAVNAMFKSGEALLLEPGYKANMLSMSAADMKVAEMNDATINAVARIFGVPPHKIGHVADEKYSNMEVMERAYAHDVVIPIARLFEIAMARSLLTKKERLSLFLEFNRRQMEIVDFKVRSDALKVGYERGGLTHNEWRAEFGYNPLPGDAGDQRPMLSTLVLLDGDSNEITVSPSQTGVTEEPTETEEGDTEDTAEGTKGLRIVKS